MIKCSWEIWTIPDRYSINWHEEFSILIGVTGYGDVNPNKLKVTLYSENDSKIKSEGESDYKNNTYILAPDPSNNSLLTKKIEHGNGDHIFLNVDQSSAFKKMHIKPGSPGQKRLEIVLTYFDGGFWVTKKYELNYTVMTFSQKHETSIAAIAIIAGVVSIQSIIGLVLFGG